MKFDCRCNHWFNFSLRFNHRVLCDDWNNRSFIFRPDYFEWNRKKSDNQRDVWPHRGVHNNIDEMLIARKLCENDFPSSGLLLLLQMTHRWVSRFGADSSEPISLVRRDPAITISIISAWSKGDLVIKILFGSLTYVLLIKLLAILTHLNPGNRFIANEKMNLECKQLFNLFFMSIREKLGIKIIQNNKIVNWRIKFIKVDKIIRINKNVNRSSYRADVFSRGTLFYS